MTAAERIVAGRIATLGPSGFGWVDAIAIAEGRVVAAGSVAAVEAAAGPRTERLVLAPDEVAIPGLTDAHLHLAEAAISARAVDLESAPTLEAGLRAIAGAHAALADPAAWCSAMGGTSTGGVAGRPPTISRRSHRAAASRSGPTTTTRSSSHAALVEAGLGEGSADPEGGAIRRAPGGVPSGVLHEAAARLVAGLVPPATADDLVEAIPPLARELLALGVVAVHDPGGLVPDPTLGGAFAAYARLAERGELAVRVHASLRHEALPAAADRGHVSGSVLGSNPAGRARVGWQKLFADGSLGSRTAAMLEPFNFEPDRPLPRGLERGIFVTEPAALMEQVAQAAQAGVVTQIHAIGDAALRAALDALAPHVGLGPLAPRVEHVQLVDPADLPRFARLGVTASVQPVHLRGDAAAARLLWGARAERSGYPWRSLADSGALLAFGTDAPVEPIDPWPGLAMAVTRADAGWPAGTPPFGPAEALTLDRAIRAACLDAPLSAGEQDRGRLVVGQRADLVVIPAAALEEPVETRRSARVGPRRVLVDGHPVFEA